MTRKMIRQCFGIVALSAAVLLIARVDVQAKPEDDNKEVSKLLERALSLSVEEQEAAVKRAKDRIKARGKRMREKS